MAPLSQLCPQPTFLVPLQPLNIHKGNLGNKACGWSLGVVTTWLKPSQALERGCALLGQEGCEQPLPDDHF